MKQINRFTKWMKGSFHLYLGGLFIIFLLQYFRTLPPLFVQHIIDYVFGVEPSNLPGFMQRWLLADTVQQQLILVAVVSVLFTLIRVVMIFAQRVLLAKFTEQVAYGLRNTLYKHLQNLSYHYHTNAETGDLIQRVTTDVDTYRMFVGEQFVEVARMTFLLIFASYQMLQMNVTMTFISLIIAPIIFTIAFVYFMNVKRIFTEVEEAEGKMTTTLQEGVTGIRVVKAFGNERHEIEKFRNDSEIFRNQSYRLVKLMAFFWGGTDALIFAQYALTASFGIYFVVQGTLGTGQFIAFLALLGLIVWPIRQLGRIIGDFGKTVVALKRIDEIMDQSSEHEGDSDFAPTLQGNITFEGVSFHFEDDPNHLLKNISFDVKAGETVAIIGRTGSGKSTLISLLIRLLEHQEGRILIDGHPIETINKKALRKQIGLILQEPFLYSKTVAENIRIMHREADQQTIHSAARLARLHDDIVNFEEGYETLVGERGVTLSGGQKQRLAIARMLLKDKPVLVFDDSLSAVDTETDRQIREALSDTWRDTTVFIITHRITTAMEADRIIVIDQGQVVQQGSHDELIKAEGLYQSLWEIQSQVMDETLKEGEDA